MSNEYKGSKNFHGPSGDGKTQTMTGSGGSQDVNSHTDLVFADVSSGTLTVELPSETERDGNGVTVVDVKGNASSNNITVGSKGDSANVNGGSNDITVSTDQDKVDLVYFDGEGWFAYTDSSA